MHLVATLNDEFFRSQSVNGNEIEMAKQTMLKDKAGLEFEIMTNVEFELWLESK